MTSNDFLSKPEEHVLVYFMACSTLLSFTGGKLTDYFFTLQEEHIVFSGCKVNKLFLYFAKITDCSFLVQNEQIISSLCKKNRLFLLRLQYNSITPAAK